MYRHWEEVQQLLNLLGYAIKEYDNDGMELIFMSDSKSFSDKNITPLVNEVKYRKSQCKTETNAEHCLRGILEEYAESYNKAKTHATPRHHKASSLSKLVQWKDSNANTVKPVCYYVLTDAVWQGICAVADPICELLDKIPTASKYQVGISFIQFGSYQKGTKRLRYLDEGLMFRREASRDIIDYEPAENGNILKMLLGSINPWWDAANDSEVLDEKYWCEN